MQTIGILNIAGKLQQEYIDCLKREQYQVIVIECSQKLDQTIRKIDVVVLFDENQENVGGVCNLIMFIKKRSKALIWTASKAIPSVNRCVYLQLGASGNIDQNCEPEEFRLIVRNALDDDQQQKKSPVSIQKVRYTLRLSEENLCVIIDDEEISLTRLEFQVLSILYKNAGRAVSYGEIYKEIWGQTEKVSKMRVANLIFHLRQKIEQDMTNNQYIKTVRSRGYMLNLTP